MEKETQRSFFMERMMEEFLERSGACKVSLLSYRRDLEKLYSYFENEPEKAETKDLETYFTQLGQKFSSTSLTRHVSVVRSFYKYLLEKGVIEKDPMENLRAAAFCQKKEICLTREEFERLLSYPAPGFRGMRDRAMLQLLCETGLRVSELVSLDQTDLAENAVFCGTGKRRRKISLSPTLLRTLSSYAAVAEIYPSREGEKPLFITAKGTRLTRQGFWKNLKDRAIYSGIDKPLSPQTLRNSLALHLIEEGKDREEITKLLGNADVSSLRGYENRK